MRFEPARVATVEQLAAAARRSIYAAIDWIDHIGRLTDVSLTTDKVVTFRYSLFIFLPPSIVANHTLHYHYLLSYNIISPFGWCVSFTHTHSCRVDNGAPKIADLRRLRGNL